MARKVLGTLLGFVLFFWLSVGFFRWYDQSVQDVSWVRTLFWLVYFGGLAVLIVLMALLFRRRKPR